MKNLVEQRRGRVAAKRRGARRHLVENDAKREHIGSGIERLAKGLLRRHVARGSHHRPRVRPMLGERRAIGVGLNGTQELGEAKVENFHMTIGREHHVLRLEIPMDDIGRVRLGETLPDLDGELELFFRWKRARGAATLFLPEIEHR